MNQMTLARAFSQSDLSPSAIPSSRYSYSFASSKPSRLFLAATCPTNDPLWSDDPDSRRDFKRRDRKEHREKRFQLQRGTEGTNKNCSCGLYAFCWQNKICVYSGCKTARQKVRLTFAVLAFFAVNKDLRHLRNLGMMLGRRGTETAPYLGVLCVLSVLCG